MKCADCEYRDEQGYCLHPKICEGGGYVGGERERPENQDQMIYDYDEGGSFWVGPNFGCVHFKEKEVKA